MKSVIPEGELRVMVARGYMQSEIAARYGVSPGTIASRLYRLGIPCRDRPRSKASRGNRKLPISDVEIRDELVANGREATCAKFGVMDETLRRRMRRLGIDYLDVPR